MENETKEITFKDRLIQIYNDLDELNIETVQEEIDKIKEELDIVIKSCDEANAEKDEKIMQDLVEHNSMEKSIALYHARTKPTIIEYAKEDKDKRALIKNIVISACLLLICVALLICLQLI